MLVLGLFRTVELYCAEFGLVSANRDQERELERGVWRQGGKTKNTLGGSRHSMAGNATGKEALGERNNLKLPRCSYAPRSTGFLFPVPVSRRVGERVALFRFLVPILPSVSEVAFRGDRPCLRAEARALHLSLVQFSLRLAAKRLMLLCLLPRTWGNAEY